MSLQQEQPKEEILINLEQPIKTISDLINKDVVNNLLEMGFSKNVAEKAVYLNNNNIDQAMDWISTHQDDKDFEEEYKLVEKSSESEGTSISNFVNKEVVKNLMDMKYSKNVAEKACFLNSNDFNKALEWIYCNQSEKDFEEELRAVEEKKSNLTDEEATKRARELQEFARKKIAEKEKENERQQALKRMEESI